MKRFDTIFGDVLLDDTCLIAFDAHYRFQNRTWSITIWEKNWDGAKTYCENHGLTLVGKITDKIL